MDALVVPLFIKASRRESGSYIQFRQNLNIWVQFLYAMWKLLKYSINASDSTWEELGNIPKPNKTFLEWVLLTYCIIIQKIFVYENLAYTRIVARPIVRRVALNLIAFSYS